MKRVITLMLILLLSLSLFGCKTAGSKNQVNKPPQQSQKAEKPKTSIVYSNKKYGFDFSLPLSWKGYKIVTEKWEGLAIGGSQGEKVIETGPQIMIRHPKWTEKNPRQDIPIMVFTRAQWDSLQAGKFHIGAAPIGPSELGHNSKYVFALPARYNYAFPTGYQEVEDILKSHPLIAR